MLKLKFSFWEEETVHSGIRLDFAAIFGYI